MTKQTKHVLLVCTANICRSPMAEGLLKHILSRKKRRADWVVRSAGNWGESGLPATSQAISVMKARGIDLSRHLSKIVDNGLMDWADLILTMEANQREALQIEFPDKREQILMLSELIDQEYDIEDPMGQAFERFEQTARELEMILLPGFTRIHDLLRQGD